ncbi:MAG: phosphatase PAP2 family protein [Saprospiraceae bacterium]
MYNLSWNTDGYILGATMAFTALEISSEDKFLTLDEIQNLNRSSINAFDQGAVFNNSVSAQRVSDHFRNLINIAPFTLLIFEKGRKEAGVIGLMLAETLALTTGTTLVVKKMVRRIRPLAYNNKFSLEEKMKAGTTRSFFSGHTAHVSSLSFFTAKIIHDLYPNSKWRKVVWASAIVIPAFAGYMRYKAGKHFPSDILVGYGVGAVFGILIPQFHKISNDKLAIGAIPISNGAMLNLSLKF